MNCRSRDASAFTVDSTGAVRLVAASNFAVKSSYSLTVKATDTAGLIVSKAIRVNVSETSMQQAVTGSIVDGYIAGATVFQDLNYNDALDPGEPSAITNAVSAFTLQAVGNAPLKTITGFDIGVTDRRNGSTL